MRSYDNTRLKDFKACPRKFFFRHVMGWTPMAQKSAPLIFGAAWHEAMDAVWGGLAADPGIGRLDLIQAAYGAFVRHWVEAGMPHPDEIGQEEVRELGPRRPSTAFEMINDYIDHRRPYITSCEVLDVEKPFVVPLDPNNAELFYIGRIDKIIRPQSGVIRGIEHKTTTATKKDGRATKIRPAYLESFSPNAQVDGYAYYLHMTYPEAERVDIWVDAAMVHEHDTDFRFIPVEKQLSQLDAWLSDTTQWIDNIGHQHTVLEEVDGPYRAYMQAFPKNTESCFTYSTTCPFLPLCKARPNPLTYGNDPPPGYRTEVWDPLEHSGMKDGDA